MRLRKQALALTTAMALLATGDVNAQSTMTSPTAEGALPSGVSVIGGIVADLIGLNGARVVSQLAASSLYVGYAGSNPQLIGTQGGFTASILAGLGGGLSEAAFRVSLYDGDSSAGDFDYNDNTFRVNGYSFQNFSAVPTQVTTSSGTVLGSATGFSDGLLNTGFFYSSNATLLGNIFASLTTTNALQYSLYDTDAGENFYDFTQGIDSELIDVGTPPVVTPPTTTTPEPVSMVLLGSGLAGLGALRRRRRRSDEELTA